VTDHTILAAALEYAEAGIFVFPARVDIHNGRKKVYPCAHWDEASTTDPDRIRAAFRPDTDWTSVCIDTGKSGLVVVDCDGEEGIAARRTIGQPATVIAYTPGGGEHHYYRADPARPIGNSAGAVAAHVDVRGRGGFVIAPPSEDARGAYFWDTTPDWPRLAGVPGIVAARAKTPTPLASPVTEGDPFASVAKVFTRAEAREFCLPHIEALASAPNGRINDTLNIAAKVVYHFVPNLLERDQADAWVLEALAKTAYDGATWKARATLDSAWSASRRDWIAELGGAPDPLAPPAGDEPAGADPELATEVARQRRQRDARALLEA
jgi:hypothetical protein